MIVATTTTGKKSPAQQVVEYFKEQLDCQRKFLHDLTGDNE